MKRAHQVQRLLDGTSVALVILAVGIYVSPVAVSVPAPVDAPLVVIPSLAADAPSNGVTANTEGESVTSANILSSRRRAPSTRYTSPDQLAPPDYAAAFANPEAFAPTSDSVHAEGTAADSRADKAPVLYGIVRVGGVAQALVRLSEKDVVPVLLSEGDRHGAYRVTSIQSDAVVLAGPSGTRTLRMVRPAGSDSIRLHH